jgi:hypothetical protein
VGLTALSNPTVNSKSTSILRKRKLEANERLREILVSVWLEKSIFGLTYCSEISMFGYGTMGEKRTVVCQVGNFPVRYKYHEGEFTICLVQMFALVYNRLQG